MKDKTIKTGNLTIGEGMPKICIPVMGKNLEEITEHTKRAVSAQPDLLE